MDQNDVVIIAAKRTPMGGMLGSLSSLTAPELGAIAHKAAMEQANINPAEIDQVISGCVLQAGIGQAPARQAAIKAGIPHSAGATTINKMCGSGMKSIMLGHDMIKAGSANVVLASGMESMSNAPYLLAKARSGYRLGHGELKDHMFLDGLEDAYERGQLMGCFAEATARHFQFSRSQQDEYAVRSLTRALQAQQDDAFLSEITAVTIAGRKGDTIVSLDEGPDESKLSKISQLKPAFKADGTVTAANSSSISDGAASIIITSAGHARKLGIKPMARIVAQATHSQAPEWFTTAPVDAIRKVMNKAGWQHQDVDLFEINEAFAVVAMAAIAQLELDDSKVNIHGGACALGHPIGASGTRVMVTLLHALQRQQKARGIAALCIGGGEGIAMAIELV
ncbi:acetyl-CoA acetyltransferase [Legionella quinlivanii]|uniref:Acetyl-CoA acetyltransferase n=1 Tax=Legionella quinlivanii TaxID=45073 RepID=A0A0W0XZ79_9GAMM|nr:thiolase family protein [Legionella quinlivanii]KTD50097.1 acetyl-CoA acetyltransferase [Legionella quinlivanii]MCW8450158.1 thiolase family protein [Legionella quinlivanii]SEF50874.1 acetyl-CoA C-acetyltransferase [Legionella quinlivanii DSM 21216]STY11695.1 acetyl-CoA acetyltransferase [Legionella quinlivanii]